MTRNALILRAEDHFRYWEGSLLIRSIGHHAALITMGDRMQAAPSAGAETGAETGARAEARATTHTADITQEDREREVIQRVRIWVCEICGEILRMTDWGLIGKGKMCFDIDAERYGGEDSGLHSGIEVTYEVLVG